MWSFNPPESVPSTLHVPSPEISQSLCDALQTELLAHNAAVLFVSTGVGGGERWHIDRVAYGLVTGGVDHIAQCLLGILYAASLWVAIAQVDEFLQLPSPQSTYTLPVDLHNKEGYMH